MSTCGSSNHPSKRAGTYAFFGGALDTSALMLSMGASLLVQASVTSLRSQVLLQHRRPQPQPKGLYR
jgi:hypothetical protein